MRGSRFSSVLRSPLARVLRWVFVAAIVWVAMLVLMVAFEESMVYYPTRFPDGFWDLAAVTEATGFRLEDCFFDAEDGVRLHAWWCRPGPGVRDDPATSAMVLLWFHGNAGNLSHRYDMMLRLVAIPVQVFIVDYRGYGRSEGSPDEAGLYRDGRAAWRYLTRERGVAASRIVLFGKSLGGAVAVDLATGTEPAGLVIQSSFSSAADMAARYFPFVPRALIRTKMDSESKIGAVRCPKLFIHSPEDEVVPYALGRRLYEAAPEPKRFHEVVGAGHNETCLVGGRPYFEALAKFVAECAVGSETTDPLRE